MSRSSVQKPKTTRQRSVPIKPSRQAKSSSPNQSPQKETLRVDQADEDNDITALVNIQTSTERPQSYEPFKIGNVSLLNPPVWEPKEQTAVTLPPPNLGMRTPGSPTAPYQTNPPSTNQQIHNQPQIYNLPPNQLPSPPLSYPEPAYSRCSRLEDIIYRPSSSNVATTARQSAESALIRSQYVVATEKWVWKSNG